jgi:glycerophosphoryl diester phosphodiesterase
VKKIIVIQFLLLWSFVAFSQLATDELRRNLLNSSTGSVMVAAHRAAHAKYPENSLGAIKEAIRLKVDIVEIDVKVSKDGVPFLMHDQTMDRTTTGKGDPELFTWEELQQFNIVDKGKTTSLKIPSLEQELNVANGKILVDLDLKTDKLSDIIRIVNKTKTDDIVIFFDSDYEALSYVQKIDSDFLLMPRAHSIKEIDSAITVFDPPVVHIDFNCYTEESATLIKGSFARIWINALGEPDEDFRSGKTKRSLKKLLAFGADIIQTDEPELLLKILEKEGYRSGNKVIN